MIPLILYSQFKQKHIINLRLTQQNKSSGVRQEITLKTTQFSITGSTI